jgi:hypothetical protein
MIYNIRMPLFQKVLFCILIGMFRNKGFQEGKTQNKKLRVTALEDDKQQQTQLVHSAENGNRTQGKALARGGPFNYCQGHDDSPT